jgi:hypothetical protein
MSQIFNTAGQPTGYFYFTQRRPSTPKTVLASEIAIYGSARYSGK